MDVFEIVKAKLPADKLPEDILLGLFVADVGQTILSYLNRTDMPKELVFTHANMVIDMITGENRKNDQEAQSSVSSIKEGDVTVQFKAASVASSERSMENLLYDYRAQLNKFRKLKW